MKKILIVEDGPTIRWVARRMVPENSEFVTVSNYIDAWTWLSEGNVCDLIISDVDHSKDGFELLDHVRGCALLKNVPVIMLSGLNGLAASAATA